MGLNPSRLVKPGMVGGFDAFTKGGVSLLS
jgi:hypothetical protein